MEPEIGIDTKELVCCFVNTEKPPISRKLVGVDVDSWVGTKDTLCLFGVYEVRYPYPNEEAAKMGAVLVTLERKMVLCLNKTEPGYSALELLLHATDNVKERKMIELK